MDSEVRNWSESLAFTPAVQAHPAAESEVISCLQHARETGATVRPVGSRHSSTPIFATDGILLDLSALSGLYRHEPGSLLATIGPGTGLADAGRSLQHVGLSMTNLGDVDYQTIAGAIGTGTHGTGLELGNLSTMLVGGVLITGTGERLPFGTEAGESEDSELVHAVRVSLGALGILTSVTLRTTEFFELHVRKWITHIDWVLEHFEELAAKNRHFDFYWYPRNDLAQVRVMNPPGPESGPIPPGRLKTELTGPAHEVIPNARQLKFNEMEYMLPLQAGMTAFRQARDRIKERHRSEVGWRVLVRTIAADNAMLSPAHSRLTLTIALLHNHTLSYDAYFSDMEPLLRDYDGRPHWGKKHSLTAAELSGHYPDWSDFQRLRRRLDPDGVLLTPYLRELLEGDTDD